MAASRPDDVPVVWQLGSGTDGQNPTRLGKAVGVATDSGSAARTVTVPMMQNRRSYAPPTVDCGGMSACTQPVGIT